MSKWFSPDSYIMQFLAKVANILFPNFLFILCCLPVFTIGASACALYDCALQTAAEPEAPAGVSSFFAAFRKHFKQATILWLVALLAGAFLFFDYYMLLSMEIPGKMIFLTGVVFLTLLYLLPLAVLFPLAAYFKETTKSLLSNSFYLGIKHFPISLLAAALNALPVILFFLFPSFFLFIGSFFWMLFGFSLTASINARLFLRIFKSIADA